jgi:hypothetical protein
MTDEAPTPLDRHGQPLRGAAKVAALAYRTRMAPLLDRPPGRGVFRPREGHYTDKRTTPKARQGQRHGLTALRRTVETLGLRRLLDGRGAVSKALARWRGDLIADLGGPERLSTQQAALVDLAVKGKLLLDSIDEWLLAQPSLVNGRRRSVHPVVLQRQHLADGLARHLGMLGLERRSQPMPSLTEYLASKGGRPDAHALASTPKDSPPSPGGDDAGDSPEPDPDDRPDG